MTTEINFAREIADIGGTAYIVGGYVRDRLLRVKAQDKDYLVCGVLEKDFKLLFPKAKKVGHQFPVYMLNIDGKPCEVAFARCERKSGKGYKGFDVEYAPYIKVEDDLFRRDITVNSIAFSILDKQLIDPYGGRKDIQNKIIRATSSHFCEDPVRALRAARFVAQLNFTITDDTLKLMGRCKDELVCEPKERIIIELTKALSSRKPSEFFRSLAKADLLETVFPEINALIGKTQPSEYHPEGDAFEHSMLVLDKVAKYNKRAEVRFAALMHDIGKGETPAEILPHHYGHEERGRAVLDRIKAKFFLPKKWYLAADFAITEHMRPGKIKQPSKVLELILKLKNNPIGADGFLTLIKADNHGKAPNWLKEFKSYLALVENVKAADAPKNLAGKKLGDWIHSRRIEVLKSKLQ